MTDETNDGAWPFMPKEVAERLGINLPEPGGASEWLRDAEASLRDFRAGKPLADRDPNPERAPDGRIVIKPKGVSFVPKVPADEAGRSGLVTDEEAQFLEACWRVVADPHFADLREYAPLHIAALLPHLPVSGPVRELGLVIIRDAQEELDRRERVVEHADEVASLPE